MGKVINYTYEYMKLSNRTTQLNDKDHKKLLKLQQWVEVGIKGLK